MLLRGRQFEPSCFLMDPLLPFSQNTSSILIFITTQPSYSSGAVSLVVALRPEHVPLFVLTSFRVRAKANFGVTSRKKR